MKPGGEVGYWTRIKLIMVQICKNWQTSLWQGSPVLRLYVWVAELPPNKNNQYIPNICRTSDYLIVNLCYYSVGADCFPS